MSHEEGDAFMSYEEEDTCMYDVAYPWRHQLPHSVSPRGPLVTFSDALPKSGNPPWPPTLSAADPYRPAGARHGG